MEQADVAVYDRMSPQASETPVRMEGQAKGNHTRNIKLPTGLIHFHGCSESKLP